MTDEIRCRACYAAIPPEVWNAEAAIPCTACRKLSWAAVFPAINANTRGATASAIEGEGQASCFFHANSLAVVSCDECGRFLCGLCDLEIAGRHVCPTCLRQGIAQQKVTTFETGRTLYDGIVLALAIGPIIMWPFTFITAPLSVVLSFWFWRRPGSLLPRTKIRFILAILIGLAQCVGWVAFFWALRTNKAPS